MDAVSATALLFCNAKVRPAVHHQLDKCIVENENNCAGVLQAFFIKKHLQRLLMLLLIADNTIDLLVRTWKTGVEMMGAFFAVFHQLDGEGKTENHADDGEQPNLDAAGSNILAGIGFPDVVVTHLVIGNL